MATLSYWGQRPYIILDWSDTVAVASRTLRSVAFYGCIGLVQVSQRAEQLKIWQFKALMGIGSTIHLPLDNPIENKTMM